MKLGNRTCWICGDPADSREHKFKKTDLARSSATWLPADQPYFVSGSGVRRIQGPKSQLVTFGKVLCQKCNSARTQPYDLAYERFAKWVVDKDATLMAKPELDFAEIYGAEFETGVLNLLKYFAKHLGCRIASDNYLMPPKLAPSLNMNELMPFEVSFSRNSQFNHLPARGPGILANFPLLGMYSPSKDEVHSPYLSGTAIGYMDVLYRYEYAHRYSWEADVISHAVRTVRLGQYDHTKLLAHPDNGQIPGDISARQFKIGDVDVEVPVLTPEHIKFITSLQRPVEGMTIDQNLDARIKIVHAILSPFYPEITFDDLEDNLTIPISDAIWKCAIPSR